MKHSYGKSQKQHYMKKLIRIWSVAARSNFCSYSSEKRGADRKFPGGLTIFTSHTISYISFRSRMDRDHFFQLSVRLSFSGKGQTSAINADATLIC